LYKQFVRKMLMKLTQGQCLFDHSAKGSFCDFPLTYQYFHENSICVDKSDRFCHPYNNDSKNCVGENIFSCKNNLYCLPHDVVCDGFDQCGDGSDENPELCGVCPRNFGFPGVNFINILCKIFVTIFLRQKIPKPKCN